jgi:hypothetical protein
MDIIAANRFTTTFGTTGTTTRAIISGGTIASAGGTIVRCGRQSTRTAMVWCGRARPAPPPGVGTRYRAEFQAYIDDLEANGAAVYFMGCIRRGRCSMRHKHPCGRALDVCQTARGRVSARCHLPGRARMAWIAARHGLFEGGE